jgi:hypothetical protein
VSDLIPVVVFAYRRPDLLERTLASVRANGVPRIYAFSDGARDAAAGHDVAAVRALLHAIDWAPVEVHESPVNQGVATAEIEGISHVLERHEAAVMIEEDLEFVPGTYDYLCAALHRYRESPRVMGVTAWAAPSITPADVTQPYFGPRMSGLMWGTWRRAWTGMRETTAAALLRECEALGIRPGRVGRDMVESVPHEEERGLWDLRFNLHMIRHRGLFLWPAESMARHIGYDERATNSPSGKGWEELVVSAPSPSSIVWPSVEEHPGSAELWRRVQLPPSRTLWSRIRGRIARAMGT